MTELCDDAKQAIVTHLAQFRSPAEIAKLVSQDFGITVDRFQVRTYDPTNPRCACGERLRDLFTETRRKFVSDATAVPAFNLSYRLNVLQRLIEKAETAGNIKLVADLLAQAAKDTGGAYAGTGSNRFEEPPRPPITAAEARARLAARLEALKPKLTAVPNNAAPASDH